MLVEDCIDMVELSVPAAPGCCRDHVIKCAAPEHGQGHSAIVLGDWFHLKLLYLDGSDREVVVDGCSLNIAAVTAVARYVFNTKIMKFKTTEPVIYTIYLFVIADQKLSPRYNVIASIDGGPSVVEQVNNSVQFLHRQLEEGHSIYGEIL